MHAQLDFCKLALAQGLQKQIRPKHIAASGCWRHRARIIEVLSKRGERGDDGKDNRKREGETNVDRGRDRWEQRKKIKKEKEE